MSDNKENVYPTLKDAFWVKPVLWVIGIFVIQTFAHFKDEGSASMLAFPGALFSTIIEAAFLYFGMRHIMRRSYKAGLSLILAVLLLMFVAGIPFVYGGCALKTARYIKITLNEEQYLKAINETAPDAQGLRFKEFPWGGFMMNPIILVYDESDELALPPERRSKAWWHKVKNSEFMACRYSAQKIKSHFYVVDFGC